MYMTIMNFRKLFFKLYLFNKDKMFNINDVKLLIME